MCHSISTKHLCGAKKENLDLPGAVILAILIMMTASRFTCVWFEAEMSPHTQLLTCVAILKESYRIFKSWGLAGGSRPLRAGLSRLAPPPLPATFLCFLDVTIEGAVLKPELPTLGRGHSQPSMRD